jgi:hypothetical protein
MNWKLLDVKENGNSGNFKGRDCLTRHPSVGIALLFRQERALAKTLGERFGVNAESRSDPYSGDNASVDVAIGHLRGKGRAAERLPSPTAPAQFVQSALQGKWVG